MAEEESAEGETGENAAELSLHSAGELLRQAREQKDMSLDDVAKTTRIPLRHLTSIETGDFGALPGRTYAIGFAKSYARAVGLSEVTVGSQLREEMDEQGHSAYQPETSGYSPANPTSIPPKMLAWTAAGIGAIILVGYIIWRTLVLQPADIAAVSSEPELLEDNVAQPGAAPTVSSGETPAVAAPSPTGTVELTATDGVWLKIYDDEGERIFEKEMAAGEKFTVPSDADNPQIVTGRADAITVTIGGRPVAPLGTGEQTIVDVGVSAAALLARDDPPSAPANNSGSN